MCVLVSVFAFVVGHVAGCGVVRVGVCVCVCVCVTWLDAYKRGTPEPGMWVFFSDICARWRMEWLLLSLDLVGVWLGLKIQ